MHFLHHLQKVWILFKFGYLKKSKRLDFLRHSHVAYLINKGVEPILIKERVGHKDIRITLNTYGHLYPNQQRKVADLLDTEKEKSPNSGNC